MPNLFRIASAAVAALALCSCFVASNPLITKANAVWPLDGKTYTSYSWDDATSSWKQSGSGKLERRADTYRLHPDPDPGQQPNPKDDMDFLLADLGGGYFAAQAIDTGDAHTILLDVIKRDGNTVYEFVLKCVDADKALAAAGVIDKFEHSSYDDTCTVSSLDQVRKVLKARLAAGEKPHGKFVFAH